MFTHNYTKAVILKQADRREADKIYTLYTESFGLIQVIGRSIRKGKLNMGMRLFSTVQVGFIQGKSYNTLTDVSPLDVFLSSRINLGKISLFYRISETVLSLIKGEEKQEEVFSLIENTMKEIDSRKLSAKELSLVHIHFSFRLLQVLGYAPLLDRCTVCGGQVTGKSYFSPSEGGAVCRDCFNKTSFCIPIEDISTLQSFLKEDINNIFHHDSDVLGRVLEEYLPFI